MAENFPPVCRRRWEPNKVAATLPIPKLVVLPIVMLIFGVGEPSKIVIVAVGAFFPGDWGIDLPGVGDPSDG